MGGTGPLRKAVTGVNPKLSHQHPHGLLSLKCARTHTSCSLGENGNWRPEVGGEAERKAGCGRGGCLLWALSSLLGVWQSTEDDSTGDSFFYFLFFSLSSWQICFPNMYLCGWLGKWKACKQTIWQFAALALQGFTFSTTAPFHSVVMTDCVMVIKAGCGWWGGYQPSQLETPQLLGWLQCLKEDPDEETMSPFHSWGGEGRGPHTNLQI